MNSFFKRAFRVRPFQWLIFTSLITVIFSPGATVRAESDLLNINFGGHRSPGLDGVKKGTAAAGDAEDDFWNFYSRDDASANWRYTGNLPVLYYADGRLSDIGLIVSNAPGGWANGSSDPMYNTYLYPLNGGNLTVTLTNIPSGRYDVYVYGNDGNYSLAAGGTSYGSQTTSDFPLVDPPTWSVGRQYALFQAVIVGDEPLILTAKPGQGGYAIISGLQLARSAATNQEPPRLIDIDLDAGVGPSGKTGFAAIGRNADDFWNFYTRDGQGGWLTAGGVSNLKFTDGTVSSVGFAITNAPGAWANGSSDPMYNSYLYPFDGGQVTTVVTNLPAGRYNFYIYSPDGTHELSVDGTSYGTKTTLDQPVENPPVWEPGKQYVVYSSVIVPVSGSVKITTSGAGGSLPLISGLQIEFADSALEPPTIISQPASQSVPKGTNAIFTVEATGSQPIDYQWVFNGTEIAGATAQTLILTNVQGDAAGTYSVIVSNSTGFAISSNAILEVIDVEGSTLINIDFAAHKSSGLDGLKVGFGAIGQSAADLWNIYSRDLSDGSWRAGGTLENLLAADGTPTSVTLIVANAPGAWDNGSADPMYNTYLYPFDGGNLIATLTNVPAGVYDVYVYGNDGNYEIQTGATNVIKTSYDVPLASSTAWSDGIQYAVFHNAAIDQGTLNIVVRPGIGGYAVISGLQLQRHFEAAPIVRSVIKDGNLGALSIRSKANGYALRLEESSGQNPVVIYSSTDLIHWNPIHTNAPTLGPVEYTAPMVPGDRQRFYRFSE